MYSSIDRYRSGKKLAGAASVMMLVGMTAVLAGCPGHPDRGDCQSDPDYSGRYQVGRDAAEQRIAQDEAAGTAAGAALTYAQGEDDGYDVGYDEGYTEGYNDSTYGYPAGYASGYGPGRTAGQASVSAAAAGSTDGFNDGYDDGVPVGEYDGYQDGYADGYNGGFPAGQISCLYGSGGPDPEDLQYCQDLGYSDLIDEYVRQYGKTPYQRMYDIAKAANSNYQTGYAAGRAAGRTAGRGPGRTAGYNRGYDVGYADGNAVGRQEAYEAYYVANYPFGYADGYGDGYNDPNYGYGTSPYGGSYSNGTGGYGDGYYDGYLDGRASICGGSGSSGELAFHGATSSSRYGKDQSWTSVSSGHTVYASTEQNVSARLTSATVANLQAIRVLHRLIDIDSGSAQPSTRDNLRKDARESAEASRAVVLQ